MMYTAFFGLLAVATLALIGLVGIYRGRRQPYTAAGSCPPGPKVAIMPTHDAWVEYKKWGNDYGDLIYLSERNTLITNKSEVAMDLLEKRARIYSDRAMTPIMKLCGGEDILSLELYSEKWRKDRRVFQQTFRRAANSRFYSAQYNKIHTFLRQLLLTPDDFMEHTLRLSQALVYKALYGLDVDPEDPLAKKAVEVIDTLGQALLPGAFPAYERFPFLRFMPSWFPGCRFKRTAIQCGRSVKEVDTIPFDIAMAHLKSGTGVSPIAELAMRKPQDIKAIKAMGTVSYLASADTTMSSISSFLLTMCQNPDIQAKGRDEIERVIGTDRLPTFEDRQSLPYVEAIYREVMHLHPALPLGLPHVSTEDDFYRGYHIPKGCVVIPNIWAMNRDPDVYTEPDRFLPERYSESPTGPFESINNIYAFGFGRRVCAGRHMAENTIWLTIASVLATFTLGKAKDGKGNEIDIPGEYTDQFFRHPKPYRSSIVPRSALARELVLATDAE
ncbi:cytochrome P450 2 Le.CYP2 [Lentinula edodes]|uniref:cytochrome P450 2 Le.CYP2 n=1 Tax=Lentinula edodes TaxID=5353 RepID=UPI001E8DB132|nr:cytochrome P450 2 Le.CYP2 [Lentinula edodes]KAH7878626.1 cytochrome P450 2 Le.CYP2 [Lentinula edodes]